MNRNIEILNKRGKNWIVSVDGKAMRFGKRLCHMDLGVEENVSAILKELDDVFIFRLTFEAVREKINTFNLLTFLNTIYQESTLELFAYQCEKALKQQDMSYKKIFQKVFCTTPQKKYGVLEIIPMIARLYQNIRLQYHAPAERKSKAYYLKAPKVHPLKAQKSYYNYAANNDYSVKYITTISNIATFMVNDISLDICLSGRKHMIDAANVLSIIEDTQCALLTDDKTTLLSVINEAGYLCTLEIMETFFPELAMSFFIKRAEQEIKNRKRLLPARFLEEYFRTIPYRGKSRKFYYCLLEKIEDKMPEFEAQLIEGNRSELLSSKKMAVLYYYSSGSNFHGVSLNFIGSTQLICECKRFCFEHSSKGKKNIDVVDCYTMSYALLYCFSIFYDQLDIYIESAAFLTRDSVQLLYTYMLQCDDISYATIKKRLLCLRKFHTFTTGIEFSSPKSPFYNIKFPYIESPHTKPISKTALEIIVREIQNAPTVFAIGAKIDLATGMRDGTFDDLTTDSLVFSQGHYSIRYFLKKTYKYRIRNNLPVYNECQIPDALGLEIKNYIESTKSLRDKLDRPYLLIYQKVNRRSDTHLMPFVLSGHAVSHYLNSILAKANVCDENGIPISESLRSVRAEIGRRLFASGKTAEEVSSFLGNSPTVAAQSYNNCYPIDEAKKYNRLYKETIEPSALSSCNPCHEKDPQSIMFGTCSSNSICKGRDCRECPERIMRKGDTCL